MCLGVTCAGSIGQGMRNNCLPQTSQQRLSWTETIKELCARAATFGCMQGSILIMQNIGVVSDKTY